MKQLWPVYRIIIEGKGTLQEIETHWSIDDLANVNEALDAWHEAERRAQKKAQKGTGGG